MAPYVKGANTGDAKKLGLYVVSVLLLAAGSLAIISNVVLYAHYAAEETDIDQFQYMNKSQIFGHKAYGIWCGIFVLVDGALTLTLLYHRRTFNLVSMIACLLSGMFSIAMMGLASATVNEWSEESSESGFKDSRIAFNSLILVAGVAAFGLSAAQAILTCQLFFQQKYQEGEREELPIQLNI